MTLVELLYTRRYTIKSETMTSFQTLIGLAQTHEFASVTRMFSRRHKVEELTRMLCDNHRTAQSEDAPQ